MSLLNVMGLALQFSRQIFGIQPHPLLTYYGQVNCFVVSRCEKGLVSTTAFHDFIVLEMCDMVSNNKDCNALFFSPPIH